MIYTRGHVTHWLANRIRLFQGAKMTGPQDRLGVQRPRLEEAEWCNRASLNADMSMAELVLPPYERYLLYTSITLKASPWANKNGRHWDDNVGDVFGLEASDMRKIRDAAIGRMVVALNSDSLTEYSSHNIGVSAPTELVRVD